MAIDTNTVIQEINYNFISSERLTQAGLALIQVAALREAAWLKREDVIVTIDKVIEILTFWKEQLVNTNSSIKK